MSVRRPQLSLMHHSYRCQAYHIHSVLIVVHQVFSSCSHLQGVNCSGQGLSDAALQQLAAHCPDLQHAVFHHCETITCAGVAAVLDAAVAIEALDVDGCVGVDIEELMALDALTQVEEQLKAFVLPDSHSVESIEIAVLKKQLAMGVPPQYQQEKLTQSGAETLMQRIWSWSTD